MPLFEYECRKCGERFEAFVFGKRSPQCPECGSEDLEKLLSSFGVGASATGSARAVSRSSSCFSGG
ncbi:MAG: zinc ribbon domain-containing protein [Vicinamibacterales bacterium]